MFHKYQHVEKFGNTEVQNIEIGECYIFPKIDGTNASVWLESTEDGLILKAGSRTRELSLDADNAGFLLWAMNQDNLLAYLLKNPTHRLFGEWLVPHSLKTYRESAWRKFYVFDVAIEKTLEQITHEGDDKLIYLPYSEYKPILEEFDIDYIPAITKATNCDYEQLVNQLIKNVYLIEDGKGTGEGIVIKNYSFKNRAGRCSFAKIVTSEFKEKHAKEMENGEVVGKKMIEEEIAEKYVTKALCEKVKAKIEVESDGWSSKHIPRLLNTVYYDLIKEESWEFIKEFKNPTINYKTLQLFVTNKIKKSLPEVF